MGAYLSEPNLQTISEEGGSDKLSYGASAMQGWRLAQEDAHNCIVKLDEETSMFAVYDGHGGSEVAIYCSQHLPECIRSHPAYKEGKLNKALEGAFMEFDARLKEDSIIRKLKQIAGIDNMSDSADEEEAEALQEEANLPLNDLLAKYQYEPSKTRHLRKKLDKNDLLSPMVRKKPPTYPNGDLGEEDGIIATEKPGGSSSSLSSSSKSDANSRTDGSGDAGVKVDSKEGEEKGEKVPRRVDKQVIKANGDDGKVHDEKKDVSANRDSEAKCNGDTVVETTEKKAVIETKETKKEDVKQEQDKANADDEDDDEEEDEDYDEDEEDYEDVDEDEDDEEDEDEDEGGPFMPTQEKEEPGSDSGCTAVVALLRGKELVVGNAGDSRCVLSRGGEALELSFDHKPEDDLELARIEKAGGKVTPDGRVNGGLNLSRAIGDHCYKCNDDLPPAEQMISAFPDIETATLSDKDQFMVIACDGIWNVMSSQEVIDFVLERIGQETDQGEAYKLSGICEELFDACLAPDTSGDGTGCDNMTCVIVQFHHESKQATVGAKRKAEEKDSAGDNAEESQSKRSKSDS